MPQLRYVYTIKYVQSLLIMTSSLKIENEYNYRGSFIIFDFQYFFIKFYCHLNPFLICVNADFSSLETCA